MLDHVHRLTQGEPLYGRPTLSFVPFPYTPLYYALSALVSAAAGPGFLALRLVSFVSSLACFWILHRLVVKETGDILAGMLAAGVFASTYAITGSWMDLARPDSLFLCLFWAASISSAPGRDGNSGRPPARSASPSSPSRPRSP